MKRLAFILTAWVLPAGSALVGEEMPELLYSSNPYVKFPVWVSADRAINAEGKVSEEYFPPELRETIKRYFVEVTGYIPENKRDDCHVVEEHYESWVDPPDRSTLSRAVNHSDLVLLGRVTEKAYGFQFYIPGQLLRIEPSRVLHGRATLDSYYVFFPTGEFDAGPYRICKSDSRYPVTPNIGDEMLVMIPKSRFFSPNNPYLDLKVETSVVVIPADGIPSLPVPFRSSAKKDSASTPSDKAELLEAVEHALLQKEAAL